MPGSRDPIFCETPCLHSGSRVNDKTKKVAPSYTEKAQISQKKKITTLCETPCLLSDPPCY